MAWGRKRATTQQQSETATDPAADAVVEGVRADGPWDASERDVTAHERYVDLGALKVRIAEGIEVRLPTDPNDGKVASVVLVSPEGGLELRAFAAPKSGGLWDEVRADLLAEVTRLEGTVDEVDGRYGAELHIKVPVTLPSGEPGVQPTRIVGIDGPRWLLRATFLGTAALEPNDENRLGQALREIVVDRGEEPRPVREALLLTVPEGAVPQNVSPAVGPADDQSQQTQA